MDSSGGIALVVLFCAISLLFGLWLIRNEWNKYKQRQRNKQMLHLSPEEEAVKINNTDLTTLFRQDSEELAKFDKKFVNNEEFKCTALKKNRVGFLQVDLDFGDTITKWNTYLLKKRFSLEHLGTNRYKINLPSDFDGKVDIPHDFRSFIDDFQGKITSKIFALKNEKEQYYSCEAHIYVEKDKTIPKNGEEPNSNEQKEPNSNEQNEPKSNEQNEPKSEKLNEQNEPNSNEQNEPKSKNPNERKQYPLIAKFRIDIKTDRDYNNKTNIEVWFQSCAMDSVWNEGVKDYFLGRKEISSDNPLVGDGDDFETKKEAMESPKNEEEEKPQGMLRTMWNFAKQVAEKGGELAYNVGNIVAEETGLKTVKHNIVDQFTQDKIRQWLQPIFCDQQLNCNIEDEKITDVTDPNYCWNRKKFQVTNNERGLPLDEASVTLMNEVHEKLANTSNEYIEKKTDFITDIDDFIRKYQYYWFSGETDITPVKITEGLLDKEGIYINPYTPTLKESMDGKDTQMTTQEKAQTILDSLNASHYQYHLVPKKDFLKLNTEITVTPAESTIKLIEDESTDDSKETKGWIRCRYEMSYTNGATTRYNESWNRCNQNVVILYLNITSKITSNFAKIMVYQDKANKCIIRYHHDVGSGNWAGLNVVKGIIRKFT